MSTAVNGNRRTGRIHIREAITAAVHRLEAAGIASPRVDAELLAAHVTGRTRGTLAGLGWFDAVQADRFGGLVQRRIERVPLQHLTGTAAFHRIELAVGPGAFVPRPETELLVEWGLAALAGIDSPRVVDLCAGTGAIAMAVAHERPDSVVYAVERSAEALCWLHRNADLRHATDDPPVTVVAGDAVAPEVLTGLDGSVDLVLANPPYVPLGVPLPPEVGAYDPALAVYAGPDGLEVVRPLLDRAAALLRPGGWFGVEHDDSHGELVPRMLAGHGAWERVAGHPDLTGRPRFATARRR